MKLTAEQTQKELANLQGEIDAFKKHFKREELCQNKDYQKILVQESELKEHVSNLKKLEHEKQQTMQNEVKIEPIPFENLNLQYVFDTEPQPRQFIIDGFLSKNRASILAAPGGLGKSRLALQMMVSICSGKPFLGHNITLPGSVLYFNAEEDKQEIQIRLRELIETFPGNEREFVKERILRFLKIHFLEYSKLSLFPEPSSKHKIIETIKNVAIKTGEAVQLVVIDPLGFFFEGNILDGKEITAFMRTINEISNETDANNLLIHHSPKSTQGTSLESRLSTAAIKGGTGFVDYARWAGVMTVLNDDDVKRFGLAGKGLDYLGFNICKANYMKPQAYRILKRNDKGFFNLIETDKLSEIQQAVIALENWQGEPPTKTKFQEHIKNLFNVGRNKSEKIIEETIQQNLIFEIPGTTKNTKFLSVRQLQSEIYSEDDES